jgi:hypothetical protein
MGQIEKFQNEPTYCEILFNVKNSFNGGKPPNYCPQACGSNLKKKVQKLSINCPMYTTLVKWNGIKSTILTMIKTQQLGEC